MKIAFMIKKNIWNKQFLSMGGSGGHELFVVKNILDVLVFE